MYYYMSSSENEERSSILFVLIKTNEQAFSFLFGKVDQTCFQSEEPGVLYSLNRVKGLLDVKVRRVNKLSVPCIKDDIPTIPNKREVAMTYEFYSYFLLWLLEQGLVSYPSESLEGVLKAMPVDVSSKKTELEMEKIRKEREKLFRENLDSYLKNNTLVEKKSSGKDKILQKDLFYINRKKSNNAKKIFLGPRYKLEIENMLYLIRQVFFLHLRGGWFSTLNNRIKKALGARSRPVLFSKINEGPNFQEKIDDNLVCILDYDGKGERVYFDPKSPMEIIVQIDSISSLPTPEKPGQYLVGLEDKAASIWVPSKEKNITQEFLDKNKRFQYLLSNFTPNKKYNMGIDTKIITHSEYFYLISVLNSCDKLSGIPHDIFEMLYTDYITVCRKYDPFVILNAMKEKGWKRFPATKKDLTRLDLDTKPYSSTVYVWVHMKKDDFTERIIATKFSEKASDKIILGSILLYRSIENSFLRKGQTAENFVQLVTIFCNKLNISIDAVAPPKTIEKNKVPSQNKRTNTDDESESEDVLTKEDEDFIDDGEEEGMDSDDDEEANHESEVVKSPPNSSLPNSASMGLFIGAIQKTLDNQNAAAAPVLHQEENQPVVHDDWLATLSLKQKDFFSNPEVFSENPTTLISYTKHNFAPQLYLPKIANILKKAKLNEMKARLFIMMLIDRGECNIRHLVQPHDNNFQDNFSAVQNQNILNDLKSFVTLFTEAFLHSEDQQLSEEEKDILGRCYCAQWIFVKQLYKTKEEALYLQMYESKEWIPVFFNQNHAILSSHTVEFQGKEVYVKDAFKAPFREHRNLLSIVPSISDLIGNNIEFGMRSSIRNQTKKMGLTDFLEAFHNKYGADTFLQMRVGEVDMSNTFYCGSLEKVKKDSTCFSDLIYFSALHHLRRGFNIFDCSSSIDSILRDFLENVCLLNLGLIDFIETMVRMGRNNNKKDISSGYCWLILIYLNHNIIADLNGKAFNDIMLMVERNENYIEKTMNHSHKSIEKKIDRNSIDDEEDKEDMEGLFNMKYEMEKEFLERKEKILNLKGPENGLFRC